MSDFIKCLDSISSLEPEAVNDLALVISSQSFSKGSIILPPGRICQQLYFLHSGLVKLCFYNGDKEFIMRFFAENSLFTGLDSYLTQTSSYYSIMTLEPTVVSGISHLDLELLCQKHHCVETVFRKFISRASVNMMGRISEMLEENATERYNHFVTHNSDLLPRISLGELAGYLGITQVSLSRIRAQK